MISLWFSSERVEGEGRGEGLVEGEGWLAWSIVGRVLEALRSMMSDTRTAAVVLLATTGMRDGSKTLGSVVSVNCGKVNKGGSGGKEVEMGGNELDGRVDALLCETGE